MVVDVWAAVYRLGGPISLMRNPDSLHRWAGLDEAGGGAQGRVPQTTNSSDAMAGSPTGDLDVSGWTRDGIWMLLAEDWRWSPGEEEAIKKS